MKKKFFNFYLLKKQLKESNGAEIGVLKKVYAGFVKELLTTADKFGVTCNKL